MILDPAKTYADVKRSTGKVLRIFTAIAEIPDFALQGDRLIVEIPVSVSVSVGDLYYNGTFRAPPPFVPVDGSVIDNLSKIEKALGLLTAQYAGKTVAQARADFTTIYQSLP